MIDKPEIDTMAAQLDVHTSNVQRDYAFGWLLSGLFQPSNPLSQHLVLKGGNCFRKAYFENARYSNDLDFGVVQEVDPNILMQAVRYASNYAKDRSGIEFFVDESTVRPKRVDGTLSAFEAKLYFQSFYGEHEDLKMKVSVDVKEFDSIFLPVQNRALVHAYSDANSCAGNIRCLKLEELLAQKLKALLMRQHSPDLFDFVHAVFFQKALAVSRMEVLTTFFRHTAYGDNPASAKGLLLQLPFDVLRGFWEKYFDCPKVSFFTFDNAASWFKETITDLFALNEPRFASPEFGFRGSPYFSAEHRAAIFEAGRLKRLLKVIYKGDERLVEPYALTFKHAQGKPPREYLYVFDQTGGSSGQGIKSFVAENLGSIAMTDHEFDPRYPIELAKQDGYFGRSDFSRGGSSRASSKRATSSWGGVLARPAPARSRSNFGMSYRFQCPSCGKTFTRTTYSPALNAHKDKYGNACYGRHGYPV